MLTIRASRAISGGLAATTAMTIGLAVVGIGGAAADPGNPTPVDPNVITDSTAWSTPGPVWNPNGQQGVTAVYTHRDSTRTITNTILVFPDPGSATAALTDPQVTNGKAQPVAVGAGGRLTAGKSADGAQSMSVLQFTEGNDAVTINFIGPLKDPAPVDFVTEYGQAQDNSLKA
ncbi:MAG: hypothetical protein QOH60_5408 [Mycobacterium sp.]|jgi:hypothetical protein|nr:hypothetical protein [Mycobacterium sp.]